MSEYTPHNWVVIKFTQQVKSGNTGYGRTEKVFYKVLGGWSGGYLDGDAWRMNSGITRVEKDTDAWKFYGSSGSCYECRMNNYMLRMNNAHVWADLQERYGDKVEMMPEDTDWLTVDWVIED